MTIVLYDYLLKITITKLPKYQALTFSLYILKPFFPECDPPDEAMRQSRLFISYQRKISL